MTTIGIQGLFRSSVSPKRAQRTIAAIEAYFGRTVSSNTSDNTACEEASCQRNMANHRNRSLEEA